MLLGWSGIVAMAVAIGIAWASGAGWSDAAAALAPIWGKVMLVDLTVGLVLVAAWIGWRESSPRNAVVWWVFLVVGGNLTTAVYVVVAARRSSNVTELLTGTR